MESLKRCIRDIFSAESEFEILKDEMFSGISDFIQMEFKDGFDKLKKTMHESTRVNLSISRVDNEAIPCSAKYVISNCTFCVFESIVAFLYPQWTSSSQNASYSVTKAPGR